MSDDFRGAVFCFLSPWWWTKMSIQSSFAITYCRMRMNPAIVMLISTSRDKYLKYCIASITHINLHNRWTVCHFSYSACVSQSGGTIAATFNFWLTSQLLKSPACSVRQMSLGPTKYHQWILRQMEWGFLHDKWLSWRQTNSAIHCTNSNQSTVILRDIHCVPKLLTPLASNTLNSVKFMDFNEISHTALS